MDYIFLQNYWWFLVSLLGALLVFLLFVQGGNSLLFTLGRNDEERALLVNSTGRKWEFTFTTLVTFGLYFVKFDFFAYLAGKLVINGVPRTGGDDTAFDGLAYQCQVTDDIQ